MRTKEKTAIRVDIATRAVIESLERANEKNPGQCITKGELLPSATTRANIIVDHADDDIYFLEAIAAPNENFILNHWSEICLHAAKEYHKYIVWDHGQGVRLGTPEEYQQILNTVIVAIGQGIVDNGHDRATIIRKFGGNPMLMDLQLKLDSGTSGKKPAKIKRDPAKST